MYHSVFLLVLCPGKVMMSLETTPVSFCYPEIVLYLPNLALASNFEAMRFAFFVLLVISTISMVSTV